MVDTVSSQVRVCLGLANPDPGITEQTCFVLVWNNMVEVQASLNRIPGGRMYADQSVPTASRFVE